MLRKVINFSLKVFLLVFPMIILPWGKAFEKDFFVTVQFIIIGIVSSGFIMKECKYYAYSLKMMHWFFIYTFFFCAALTQFANNSYMWGLQTSIETNVIANFLIIIWMITFIFSTYINVKNINFTKSKIKSRIYKMSIKSKLTLGISLLLIGLVPFFTNGVSAYMYRTVYSESTLGSFVKVQAISLLIQSIVVGFCLWLTIFSIIEYRKSESFISKITVFISFLTLLLNIPPLGVPRFEVAAVYCGILLYNIKKYHKNNIFLWVIVIGLFVLFPFLNAFRGTVSIDVDSTLIVNSIGSIDGNFLRADYDAYSMLLYTVEYIQKYGVTYGYQLLGVLLFFVPRSIWTSKPDGSGATIIDSMVLGFDQNVSCPIVAEGYINFGIYGVILFSCIFARIAKKFDKIYWDKDINNQLIEILYTSSVPFIFFIMRGDMLSTISFYIGFCSSLFIFKILFLDKQIEV